MSHTHVPADRRDRPVSTEASVHSRLAAPQRGRGRWLFDNKILPWLLLLPALITIFGLVLYPVIQAVWLSFHSASIEWLRDGTKDFVALDNYIRIFTEPLFRRVIITTAVFGIACVIATMVVGLLVALLLNQPFVGRRVVAVIALVPWAIAGVAAGRIWQWLFEARYGVVNHLLSLIPGVDMVGFAWFNARWSAFLAIGIVVIWQSYPFVAVALLAGFQSISPEVMEAARVDGAGPWQRLRHITLPILRPLVMVLIIISTIWDFKIFDQVFVMTGGGPARSTEVIAITTIAEGFGRRQFGLGAALAMTLFVILMAITVVYIRMIRDEEGA
ncbi:MAG TPA: sugar ABC transporter permease [Egibacteraceae bacterium]|nr:sugar ABC transporter permease [Egibacteraceae bacterium]